MSSGYENVYRIFGLEDGASIEKVKKKYRSYAWKYHPDRAPDDIKARRKFEIATEAYRILIRVEKSKNQNAGAAGSKKYFVFNLMEYSNEKQNTQKRAYVTKRRLNELEYNALLETSRDGFKRFLNSVEKIKK